MPAQVRRSMKSARLLMLGLKLTIGLSLILMGCANLPKISTAATKTASAKPLACSELRKVQLHAGKITIDGKDAFTRVDADAALALPSWPEQEAQLRRLAGDTTSTITAVKANNAVLDRLCR